MEQPLWVLLIEDSASDAELIIRLLQAAKHQVCWERVEDAAAMRAALERRQWDAIIADYYLPQFDAPAALQILKESGQDIPFIVVSGRIGEEAAVATMKCGAHDYLLKKNLARLAPAVEREIRQAEARREHRQAEEELYRLTKLVNLSHDAIITADANRVITGWNAGAREVYGWTEAEAVGQTMHQLLGTESPVSLQEIGEILLRENRWDGELVHRRRDGAHVIVESRQVLLRGEDRQPGGVLEINRDITDRRFEEEERKRAEQDLRKLLRAVEHSPVSIVITDSTGAIEYVNPIFTRITGYSYGEIVGQNPRIFKSGLTSPAVHERLWQTILSGGEWKGELKNRKKNGELYWESMSISPILNHEGKITHFIAVKEDVTRRKEAEEALRSSEERFRLITETISEVFWMTDREITKASYVSPAYELVWGRSCESFYEAPQSFLEAVHPDDLERTVEYIRSRMAREQELNHEYRIVSGDGSIKHIWSRAFPVLDSDDQVRQYVGLAMDITERKRAELSQAALASIVDYSDDAIIGNTIDGRITSWNKGAERLYGYRADEVQGESMALLLPPGEEDQLRRTMDRLQRGERIDQQDVLRRRKDGSLIDVAVTISPIKDRNGQITGASAIARDITCRKQAERQSIIERERAEKANQAKSEFLANMSHEIRTPMNGIIGAAGLLLGTALTPEQREYAEIVRLSGEALLNVISGILDFSRIEAGKVTIESVPFDLKLVLEEVEDLLIAQARNLAVKLRLEYPAELPSQFSGDAGRIRQVVLNLADNAVKFTAAGEVLIGTECIGWEGQTALIKIRVRDTGPGIAADKAHLLFQKFSQLDSSATRKYGGTGLGLAISKQLVEMLGGSIGVNSREGEGSTFWFTLPLIVIAPKPPDESANRRAEHSREELLGKFAGYQARVLVAEDNAVNQKVVVRMLEKLGLRADVAGNGKEAVQMYAGLAYSLILMDCQMPEMDGYEATCEIRRSERSGRHVPIIAMTADAFASCHQRCLQTGMDDYVSKPVMFERLADVLARWVPAGRFVVPPKHMLQ